MATDKQLIFVLGMHRSGTSAVTRLINLLGADLGKKLIDAEQGVNDEGFWENSKLVSLNEGLLKTFESNWFDYGDFPSNWWNEERFNDQMAAISHFLEQEFPDSPLRALKDPRLCRLLPIWNRACLAHRLQRKYLLVLRSPDEVRRSLTKRDPFTPLTADLLWLRYIADAELHSRAGPRVWIDYDELLLDWAGTAERIADQLQIRWPVVIDEVRKVASREIDPQMRHHHGAMEGNRSVISDQLQAIYTRLRQAAGEEIPAELRSDIDALLTAHQPCASALLEVNHRIAETTQRMQELGGELLHARKELAYALSIVNERDDQLTTRNTEFEQLEKWSCEMEQTAKQNWQFFEESQRRLHRITGHPITGSLCRLLKLIDTP